MHYFLKMFLEAGHLNNRDLILARMFLEWADQMVELTHSEELSGKQSQWKANKFSEGQKQGTAARALEALN